MIRKFILCRFDNDGTGTCFSFDTQETLIKSALKMVTKLGWSVDNIIIFDIETSIKFQTTLQLEDHS